MASSYWCAKTKTWATFTNNDGSFFKLNAFFITLIASSGS